MDEEQVTISKKEYESLKEDAYKLQCLESGGVDNWDWYHESLKDYYKQYHPDDEDEDE